VPAIIQTFGPLLKQFYQSPITDQINERVWARKYFQKSTTGWSGSQMRLPIHISRNTGTTFAAEGVALPVAGQQDYDNLVLHSSNSYGSFRVSGELMDTAVSAGRGAFEGVMKEEMNRLVRDMANMENHATIFGGEVKGFLNERKVGNVQPGAGQNRVGPAGFSAVEDWEYQGDFSYFNGAATGTPCTPAAIDSWVRVRLFRLDTYTEILPSGNNDNIMVVAATDDRVDPSLTLRYGSNNAAGTDRINTLALPAGTTIAVVISGADATAVPGPTATGRATDSAAAPFGQDPTGISNPTGALWPQLITSQPAGIFTNLASQTHFGVNRTTVGGVPHVLQSSVITHSVTGSSSRALADADLSLERLQYMFDTLMQDSGMDPDLLVMNALMRHRYTLQLTGIFGATPVSNVTVDGSSGKLMANQDNLAYGGVKFQYDRHFPICTIALLSKEPWLLAELTTGQFADADGNVLNRVAGFDTWEGFWKHRYNMVCKRPNSQLILTGISPV